MLVPPEFPPFETHMGRLYETGHGFYIGVDGDTLKDAQVYQVPAQPVR